MTRFAAAIILFAALGTGAILSAQAPRTIWRGGFSDAQATRGAAIYQKKCTHCHSDDFHGNVDGGPPLKGPAFDMRWAGLTVLDIVNEISELMPATDPGGLPRQDYVDVLAFIFRSNGATMGPADLKADDAALGQVQGTVKPAN